MPFFHERNTFFLESVLESHFKRRNCKTELVHKSEKIFIYRHVKIMLQHFKENCNEPSICSNGQTKCFNSKLQWHQLKI